ncbi:MAG: OsmC family peroxiredoxin [Ignavibacteriae bacterium]|nr:MAG: OsmC family peroxiredoxin [Ignavibacteriota bacterium]
MNSEEFRSIQKPLKEKYREEPASAIVTLKAHGKPGEGVTCRIDTARAVVEAGLHPATGGTGQFLCSGDMLLEALVACAGVTLMAVAASLGVKLKDASITAEGDIDFRGTLAVSKEAKVGFKDIRLYFFLDTGEEEEKINSLIKLTERYCVVYQSLKSTPEMKTEYKLTKT